MVHQTVKMPKATLLGVIGSQCIAFVVCVLIPGLVTAIAPVSWVKFQRSGDRVTARVQVCLFFVVPYKTTVVDPVSGIDNRQVSGTESRERRSGRHDRVTKSEDEGFLVIQGVDQTAEVSVTPVDLKSVTERSEAFLKDAQATELKLFAVANWKFSVIAGGIATLLAAFYVVSIVGWMFVAIYKGLRGSLRFATRANVAVEKVSDDSLWAETKKSE